ncbi:MAG: hypothetical protein FWH35_03330 [Treponema sp.]|nr:hypothetical protein [Treponema sp.]
MDEILNMKKKIIIFVFLFNFLIFSINSNECEQYYSNNIGLNSFEGTFYIYSNKKEIALVKLPLKLYDYLIYDIINKESIKRDIYGFPVATLFGRETHLFFGGNFVLFRFLDEQESGMVFSSSTCYSLLDNGYEIWPSGIEISCSSYLVEGSKHYTVNGLNKMFLGVPRDGGSILNTTVLPWAEGEDGPGIGVSFAIKFVPNTEIANVWRKFSYNGYVENIGLTDEFVIMNGYVDFYHPDLFLKNNRVKKLFIKSTDDDELFEFEYELKDIPEFQAISLPRRTHSFEMTIIDVYKGNLYNDTVITAILPIGKNYIDDRHSFDNILNNSYYKKWDGK